MNAIFIRKRNESVNRMLSCLAGADFASGILSSGATTQSNIISTILSIASVLAVVILGLMAPIHYLLACEHCINARGSTKASLVAGAVLTAAVVSFIVVSIATSCPVFVAFHVVLPVTFALSALPLKLIPNRA